MKKEMWKGLLVLTAALALALAFAACGDDDEGLDGGIDGAFGCTADVDCAEPTPVCNEVTGECEAAPPECAADDDCTEAGAGFCHDGTCEACDPEGTDCTGDTPVCNEDTGECEAEALECVETGACANGNRGCAGTFDMCLGAECAPIECTTNADCDAISDCDPQGTHLSDPVRTFVCDTTAGQCKAG